MCRSTLDLTCNKVGSCLTLNKYLSRVCSEMKTEETQSAHLYLVNGELAT